MSIKSEEILASIKIFVPESLNCKYVSALSEEFKKRKKQLLIIILRDEHSGTFE